MSIPRSNRISKAWSAASTTRVHGDVDEYFAQMGRDSEDDVRAAARLVLAIPFIQKIINAMPVPVAILNEKSQVVASNRSWERLAVDDSERLLGKRHGEQLGCLGFSESPDGCGTGASCSECGAAASIMQSQVTGEQVTSEFRLLRMTGHDTQRWDLMVTTTPIEVDGRRSYFFVLHKIDPSVSVRTYDIWEE